MRKVESEIRKRIEMMVEVERLQVTNLGDLPTLPYLNLSQADVRFWVRSNHEVMVLYSTVLI